MLKAGLSRVHRGPATVQFGTDPDRAVVLTGLDAGALRYLDSLDGSISQPEPAGGPGVPAEQLHRLLDELAAADLLEDGADAAAGWTELPLLARDRLAPDLASLTLLHPGPGGGKRAFGRRLQARVEIRGGGRVGAATAGLLAAAGVGRVRVRDDRSVRAADLTPGGLGPGDLGAPRGAAATRAAGRHSVGPVAVGPMGVGRPDLVVFADAAPAPGVALDTLMRAGVAHLVAVVRDLEGVVGPMVVPGQTSCVRCHHLTRTDRDRQWPRVAAQLAAPAGRHETRVRPCDVALASAVASHAALQALAFLDAGAAGAMDGTLHLALPDGTVRRRSWQRHPACGCAWEMPLPDAAVC